MMRPQEAGGAAAHGVLERPPEREAAMDGGSEILSETLWQAVRARREVPGRAFVYGVRSTGIYCRPTCPARLARRENVAFYPNAARAEAAGLRACKRCDPRGEDPAAALIAASCRRIEGAETPPSLAALAAEAGYSPFHFHRLFKARTGLTPRQYAAGRRAERLRAALAAGESVTAAIYDAGYGAASRFYAEASAVVGMAPAQARRGGAGERIGYALAPTSLGLVLAAATPRGLCAISLGDDAAALEHALRQRFKAAALTPDPALGGLLTQVVEMIEQGTGPGALPLDLRGTAFQMRVWRALQAVPAGETISYAALAAQLGAPGSARAVAGACAANPLALAVPCHRAVRTDGSLAGYRWGPARKRALLEREGQGTAVALPCPTSPPAAPRSAAGRGLAAGWPARPSRRRAGRSCR